jgi:hypothetical protein
VKAAATEISRRRRLGLVHPGIAVSLPAVAGGKSTPLRKALIGLV